MLLAEFLILLNQSSASYREQVLIKTMHPARSDRITAQGPPAMTDHEVGRPQPRASLRDLAALFRLHEPTTEARVQPLPNPADSLAAVASTSEVAPPRG